MGMTEILSWGRTFRFSHDVQSLERKDQRLDGKKLLPFGMGRSYGDSCLNENGTLLATRGLHRVIHFDNQAGTLEVESGMTLEECLNLIVPSGWFLPVLPGTKFVTVGGAIANDIHGKNHHHAGTFGCHLESLELRRSDGTTLRCSSTENKGLFRATIGGLGLTGLITSAKIRLKKITSPRLQSETIRCSHLDELLDGLEASDRSFEYTVAWLDVLSTGRHLGRGILMRANHAFEYASPNAERTSSHSLLNIPFEFPFRPLNRLSVKAFNFLYYLKHWKKRKTQVVNFEPFFFPLDSIGNWNRIYGKEGLFQYQFVLPISEREALKSILRLIAEAKSGSFLCVLKKFGCKASPGLLSFPTEGYTLAVDFPNCESTKKLIHALDQIVIKAHGRLYPAKDALMSPEMFRASYPHWNELTQYIDPAFSSSFWRRVTE